ncbi:MAG: hypothetical protein GQ469_08680 [Methanosarcinales archaeon]|nr:hypothetical protein [Methanosarcinales archaeon]
MKIKGNISIKAENAPDIAVMITRSLEPDNLESIRTEYGGGSVTTFFESGKIGSLIATVDDYLMNARIAADMLKTVGKDNKENCEDDD